MTYSTIRKAAAPITGGVSWPLVDEATSTAPAFSGAKPMRFINGMVKVPVVTVLAMDEPEIMPVIIDDSTAAFAGPPRRAPSSAIATLMNQLPPPALSRSPPNNTKRKIIVVDTPSATPNTPSVCIQ